MSYPNIVKQILFCHAISQNSDQAGIIMHLERSFNVLITAPFSKTKSDST